MGSMDEISSLLLQNIKEVEQKDEKQVLAELAGESLTEYIYETTVDEWVTDEKGHRHKEKRRKVKLSWVGTREVARSHGKIMLSEPVITDVGDNIRFVVKATDVDRAFTVFGGTQQPKQIKVIDWDKETNKPTGEFHYEEDPYVFSKGLSKAQRNALSACIPTAFAARMIDLFLKQSGKQPMLNPAASKALVPGEKPNAAGQKREGEKKPVIKARAEWDKITEADIKDTPALYKIVWDLAKLQPDQISRALGGLSTQDLATPEKCWTAFITVKELYAPVEISK
jgi:hypothetical protein